MTTTWYPFDDGASLGKTGSESGAILLDDEHPEGARITLEEGTTAAPFAITCGIYGWMVHTRFFGDRTGAEREFGAMKDALESILAVIAAGPGADEEAHADEVTERITAFVADFP